MARDLIEVKHLGQGALRATLLHWGFVEGAPWFSDRRGYKKKMAEKGSVEHSMRSDKVEIRCTLLGKVGVWTTIHILQLHTNHQQPSMEFVEPCSEMR